MGAAAAEREDRLPTMASVMRSTKEHPTKNRKIGISSYAAGMVLRLIIGLIAISFIITFGIEKEMRKISRTNLSLNVPNSLVEKKSVKKICSWSNANKKFVSMGSREMFKVYPRPNDSIKAKIPNLTWSNVVVLIMTYNSESENNLIQKHFDSWIKRMPSDLDVLFVTDSTDKRSYTEALPDAEKVDALVLLYQSPATNEGSQARRKAVDTFRIANEIYKDRDDKKIFLKIDPDTYIIPENMLNVMNEMHKMTYPHPVDFGRVDCTKVRNGDCYSLGASYGLNKKGLAAVVDYIESYPDIFDTFVIKPGKIIKNRMMDEDFFISHIFHEATCLPTIHISGMSIRLYKRDYEIRGPVEQEWDKTDTHVTIHLVKKPETFDRLDNFYYANGRIKPEFEEHL